MSNAMEKFGLIKLTLLLASMVTMMAGAIVAPCLPNMQDVFKNVPNVAILIRLVITLPAIFIAFFGPVYGALADKYGRLKLLYFALILYAVSGTSGYYLENLMLILVGRALLGVAVAGIMTIAMTLIGDYFEGEERNKFMGIQGAFMGIGGIVFISLAGVLADVHWQLPFLLYAFSIIVLVLAILYLVEPDLSSEKPKGMEQPIAVKAPVFELVAIYFTVFVGIVFFYMMPVQLPFLIKKLEGVNNTMIGLAISLSTFASAVVAMNYPAVKRKFSYQYIYFFTFLLMGVGYYIISISESYSMYLLGIAVSGMGTGFFMPNGNLWLINIIPPANRGKLVGLLTTFMFVGMFFSPIIIQPIINSRSIAAAFQLASYGIWGMGILFLVYALAGSKR